MQAMGSDGPACAAQARTSREQWGAHPGAFRVGSAARAPRNGCHPNMGASAGVVSVLPCKRSCKMALWRVPMRPRGPVDILVAVPAPRRLLTWILVLAALALAVPAATLASGPGGSAGGTQSPAPFAGPSTPAPTHPPTPAATTPAPAPATTPAPAATSSAPAPAAPA